MREIVAIVDLSDLPFNSAIPLELSDKLENSLYIKPNYENHIKYIKDLMSKDWGFQIHKLPLLSEKTLKQKWDSFCLMYRLFVSHLVNRLTFQHSRISIETILQYVLSMSKKHSKNQNKMEKVSEKYKNFSELTNRLNQLKKNE